MKIIKLPDLDIVNKDSNYPDPYILHLSQVPKKMPVPASCPNCHRTILGDLETYANGVTCIDCNCSFKYVYDFPLHE